MMKTRRVLMVSMVSRLINCCKKRLLGKRMSFSRQQNIRRRLAALTTSVDVRELQLSRPLSLLVKSKGAFARNQQLSSDRTNKQFIMLPPLQKYTLGSMY
jgi:hypothetical protein